MYVVFDRSKRIGFFEWILNFKNWEQLAMDLALPLLNAPDVAETTATRVNYLTEQDY
jgi:hypothetical protein